MPHYLLQAAYNESAWAAQLESPRNRREEVRAVVESLGGSLESFYFSFGDYDALAIVRLPDNVTAAALSMAASASGGLKAVRTTPLMSAEDAVEAMRKAAGAGYRAPGA